MALSMFHICLKGFRPLIILDNELLNIQKRKTKQESQRSQSQDLSNLLQTISFNIPPYFLRAKLSLAVTYPSK